MREQAALALTNEVVPGNLEKELQVLADKDADELFVDDELHRRPISAGRSSTVAERRGFSGGRTARFPLPSAPYTSSRRTSTTTETGTDTRP